MSQGLAGAIEQGATLGPHEPLVCIGSKTVDAQSLHIELQCPDTLNSIDDEKDVVVATLLAEGGEPSKDLSNAIRACRRFLTKDESSRVDRSAAAFKPQVN